MNIRTLAIASIISLINSVKSLATVRFEIVNGKSLVFDTVTVMGAEVSVLPSASSSRVVAATGREGADALPATA